MCGIFGVTNFSDERRALEALRTFAYRGPDHTGYLYDGKVFMGNNRLSIIDLDERSNQPQFNANQQIAIVFNGEIFNYKELRKSLVEQGYEFKTESDTEVVLKLYEQYGESFTSKIRGMFAIAIFDKTKNKILIQRDHVGIKPVYYSLINDRFIFSSELKGLTAIEKELKLSRRSFLLASALGYVPSPFTIYENVHKLPAGAMLVYDLTLKTIEITENVFAYKKSDIQDLPALTELIEEKILSHLVGDVAVGLFFSGGTDSSLIAAVLKKHNISLKTYSIIMRNKPEDAAYIDKIGEYLNLKMHKEFFGVTEFNSSLEELRSLIDEPTHDSSMLALHHISKVAAREVKVVLSGEGADEFFFGYRRHRALTQMSFGKSRISSIFDAFYNMKFAPKGKRKIFMALYKFINDPYSYYLAATTDRLNTQGWSEWRSIFREKKVSPIELDQKFYLENDLLRKMDFATSYASIEGRVPFLDADIISASRNFYAEFKNDTLPKPVLKKILNQYIPPEMVYRGKSGLGLPLKNIFNESECFKDDFSSALHFLREQKEFTDLLPTSPSEELAMEVPYYSFLLLTYYYAIRNTSIKN